MSAWGLWLALGLVACDDGDTPTERAQPAAADQAVGDAAPSDAGADGGAPDQAVADMTAADQGAADMAAPDQGPPAGGLQPGPYGTGFRDLAGPFTLPTTEGEFDYAARFTGEESVVFVFYAPGNEYSAALFSEPFGALIEASPRSVHYVFLAYQDGGGAFDVPAFMADLQFEADSYLRDLPVDVKAHWFDHVHFVTTPAQAIGGWLGDTIQAQQAFHFAIDRTQRLRQIGNTGDPVTGFTPRLSFVAHEARYYDYEVARDAELAGALASAAHVSTVALARQVPEDQPFHVAESRFDVAWPDDLDRYDQLLVDLVMHCPEHTDRNCGEWDYLAHLRLCEPVEGGADGELRCDLELGRWITTYSREGRWVTDLTPMLARLRQAGWPTQVRFHNPGQPNGGTYDLQITFHLLDTGAPDHPVDWQPMFTGGAFNADYNLGRDPLPFTVPEGATRVQLVTLNTGHGFGRDAANCAEFCDHTHHFRVDADPTELVQAQPYVNDRYGCVAQIDAGTVPNQYGTWVFGRGGWCPGLDVPPWIADLTALAPAGEHLLAYEGRLAGEPYTPEPRNGEGFGGRIALTSGVVIWMAKP